MQISNRRQTCTQSDKSTWEGEDYTLCGHCNEKQEQFINFSKRDKEWTQEKKNVYLKLGSEILITGPIHLLESGWGTVVP